MKSKTVRQTVVIMLAANKGGTGKTTVAQHLIELAHELGKTVVAVDTDPQADLCGLLGEDGQEWGEAELVGTKRRGVFLCFSPGEVPDMAPFLGRVDLVVIDTPPKAEPDVSVADCVVVPIDGPSAIKDCAETIYACVQADVKFKIVVPNKLDAGGQRLRRALADGLAKNEHVQVSPEVPLSPCVARTADTHSPAWRDLHGTAEGARRLRETCSWILREVGCVAA